jgi:ferrous iron transport protein B
VNRPLRVALAGNPNAGKTTLFNLLTGSRQHVANYPGVTVESREGILRYKGVEIIVTDLPGTYSLTSYTEEERVARHHLEGTAPDLVVQVVDASNLERNLYLAVQIMELGLPLVLAFNMSDLARARGLEFDLPRLSTLLGAPIVTTVGHRGQGIRELCDAIIEAAAAAHPPRGVGLHYGPDLEAALETVEAALRAHAPGPAAGRERWVALKLIENDRELRDRIASPAVEAEVEARQKHLQALGGDVPEMLIADRRYGFISGACTETVRTTAELRHTASDRIDAVLAHPLLGIPIFLAIMYVVFTVTFTLGGPPMEWLEAGIGALADLVRGAWPAGRAAMVQSLIVDGILGGVGGVVAFLPNIVLLFASISILEDSGYMARAAFLMDRLMQRVGLHGRSFIPLLVGFGCTVPAILATRTLESRRDRLTTMLVLPLMSCGARLPIYTLLIPAFFPAPARAPVLWMLYLVGIGLAIAGALTLRRTLFRGESEPLVMELPPYRVPTLRGIATHMAERGWMYLRKAGTVILAISVVLWALTTYPRLPETAKAGLSADEARAAELAHSTAGRIGHFIEPALKPMGFDWRAGTAMIGAFAAKEVFVAQLGIVFAVGNVDENVDSLRARLRGAYTPLQGLCMMLFMLVGTPCMATVAVTRRESGSWRWALLQFGALTAVAYVLTTLVFQAGRLMGF